MFRKDPESRDFKIALVAVGLIVAALAAYVRWVAPREAPLAAKSRWVDDAADRAPDRAPDRNPSAPPVIARVYECRDANGRVLSDRPCGADANVREVLAPNSLSGGSGPPATAARAESRPGSAPRYPAKSLATPNNGICESIAEEIDRINARMRSKYSNAEGERFRRRLTELSDERWDAKCRQRR